MEYAGKSEFDYKIIAEYAYDWETWEDETGELKYVSPACMRVSGYTVDEYMQDNSLLSSIIIDEDKEKWTDHRLAIIAEIGEHSERLRIRNKNGDIVWIDHHCKTVIDEKGVFLGYRANNRDITNLMQAEAAIVESEKRFRTLFDFSPISVLEEDFSIIKKRFDALRAEGVTDWRGYCNEHSWELTECAESIRIVDVNQTAVDFFHADSKENFDREIAKTFIDESLVVFKEEMIALAEGRTFFESEMPVRDYKGNKRILWLTLNVDPSKTDTLERVMLSFYDITERKRLETALAQEKAHLETTLRDIEYLSYHDQLTGLYNRRFYEEELKRLNTGRNLPMTIVMGDVNGLKLINDSFGHAMGDELLQKSAEAIRKGCRADDIIARLGGDEFVIILPKTDASEAENIIKRIMDLASKEKVGTAEISISFGYETKTKTDESIDRIFKNAEDRMYKLKISEGPGIRANTINVIMDALYEKNIREQLHSIRVSEICEAIASEMGFDKNEIAQIRIAGLMHDIGNIGIEEKILNKPQKLNDEERDIIERHSEIGYRIFSSAGDFSKIAGNVLEHHEKWNGEGYPRGLKGEEISLQARIIAVAEAYDAMTSEQPYSKALSAKEAIIEIRKCSGTQFDPIVAKIFIKKVLNKNAKI